MASEAQTPPCTVIQLFKDAVRAKGDKEALAVERPVPALVGRKAPPALPLSQWRKWTFRQYYNDASQAARSFMHLGVEQHDAVAIYAFNAPEWHISEIGAIFAGAKAAGIYPTDTSEQLVFKCNQSGASVIVVDALAKLQKIAAILPEMPHIKVRVVWWCGPAQGSGGHNLCGPFARLPVCPFAPFPLPLAPPYRTSTSRPSHSPYPNTICPRMRTHTPSHTPAYTHTHTHTPRSSTPPPASYSNQASCLPCLLSYTVHMCKAVVCFSFDPPADTIGDRGVRTLSWAAFLSLHGKTSEKELEDRQAAVDPGHCCALIYTSGTTGEPKAVMISHDNIIFESRSAMCVIPHIGAMAEQERIVSYLPLSHVAGMMVDIIMPICITAYKPAWTTCYFARPYDLKAGSIVDRLKAVQPTIFLGVPRVWEKVAEKLKAVGATIKGAKRTMANWAKNKGLQHQLNKQLGGSGEYPFMYGLADKIVLSGVKAKLGLDKCKFGFTGAAPITTETLSFFGKLGIQVNEVYGMSECTGATSFSNDSTHIWGSCGFAMPGCEVAIRKENGDLCPRAADIFNAPEIAQVRPSQCLRVY